MGDTVKIHYSYEWEYLDKETGEMIPEEEIAEYAGEVIAKETESEDVLYEVAACVMVKNAMSFRNYGSHEFVLNADVYQRDNRNADVMVYLFDTAKSGLCVYGEVFGRIYNTDQSGSGF